MMRSLTLAALLALFSIPSWASLTTFQTYVGTYGVSTDGFGSTSNAGTISASVPAGATVVAAYLYTAYFDNNTVGGTLNSSTVSYGGAVDNATACCGIGSRRADVTSIVAPVIDGGSGGVYNFDVTEDYETQDGEALVVIYSLASLPTSTIATLDGFASVLGDTTTLSFSTPLNPGDSGFVAEMFLGINFSCCDQNSSVTVNGATISEVAGNNDDAVGELSNGNLLTVGGFDDPYSAFLPSYANDHERYNLIPYITVGDTQIQVNSANASGDDNIFLAVFNVSGAGSVSSGEAPEPGSVFLFGGATLAMLAWRRVRRTN